MVLTSLLVGATAILEPFSLISLVLMVPMSSSPSQTCLWLAALGTDLADTSLASPGLCLSSSPLRYRVRAAWYLDTNTLSGDNTIREGDKVSFVGIPIISAKLIHFMGIFLYLKFFKGNK